MLTFDIICKSGNNITKEVKCGYLKYTKEGGLIIRLDNTLPVLNNCDHWVTFLKLCECCCSFVDHDRTEYTVTASELCDADLEKEREDFDDKASVDLDNEAPEEVGCVLMNPEIFGSGRFKLVQRK